jgi:hypothetical protein
LPSGSFFQADVGCPFYKYDDGRRRITCEGLVDESSVALIFNRRSDYELQIREFCCKYYKNCEIYRILMEKYEEDNI